MRIRLGPPERLSFRLEKPINDKRAPLGRVAAGLTRGFTANDMFSGINRHESGVVREKNFAAVRDSFRIDCTMSCAQTHARRGLMFARPVVRAAAAAGPINGHASENVIVPVPA